MKEDKAHLRQEKIVAKITQRGHDPSRKTRTLFCFREKYNLPMNPTELTNTLENTGLHVVFEDSKSGRTCIRKMKSP